MKKVATNSIELIKKINHVKTSRYLRSQNVISEHLEIPTDSEVEEKIICDAIFQFLKTNFTGCRLRVGNESISLRLDGSIHRKANKIREIFEQEHEWRTWFERNHSNIYRQWRDNRSNWNGGYAQVRELSGKMFVYVPFKPSRIPNYFDRGIIPLLQFLKQEHEKDSRLANICDDTIRLMEEEVERRERERREKLERELNEYTRQIRNLLYKPVTALQESKSPVDRRLAEKMIHWARENGKAPEYVLPATYKEMVPLKTKVQVMNEINSQEENWYVVPMFEGYEIPEGYELQEGWGRVTRHDPDNERARKGTAPIVVEEYIFLSFDIEQWKHLLPEGYNELLTITEQYRKEAEEEMAPFLEEEKKKIAEATARAKRETEEARKLEEEARKIAEQEAREAQLREEEERRVHEEQERQEREQQEAREREEMERTEREATEREERRRRLAEQLRAQVTEQEVPYTPPQVIPSDERAEAAEQGLYRNSRAIPLERYVAINEDGNRRRFRTQHDAAQWLGYSFGDFIRIRDFHEPHESVETYEHQQQQRQEDVDAADEDLPF